ncbi:MAG: glycerophosphodiester phosphodiesterase, partial [Anaerolineales bacterium]|nr:glycerophosphodiester phosphodiesterase [Anaerolineales bacterium]
MSLTWQSVLTRPRAAPPLLMAHRGSSDELPENTLAAFQRALEQGADVLETDIRFTRDDEILLMHDPTLERTTNGAGVVAEMTLANIKTLRAQKSFESKQILGAEEIPTLAEFLASTRAGDVPVALELKDNRFIQTRDAEKLIRVLQDHSALERTTLLSFNGARVRACKRVAPQIPIGIITLKNPFPLYDTELMGPFFPLLYLNPFYFAWAKRRGKIACPLDPAPEPRVKFYRRIGAPVLLTNHPAVTRAVIGNR